MSMPFYKLGSFLGYEKWNTFIMNDDVAVVCILPIDEL
jgi:hypothetical protein